MFVGDIKHVELPEVVPLSSWVGLDCFKESETVFGASRYFSFETGFKFFSVSMDGEASTCVDSFIVPFDKGADNVIEGCSQIVNSITRNQIKVKRKGFSGDWFQDFSRGLCLLLKNKEVVIFPNKSIPKGIKVVDVLVGPFDF